MAHGQWTEIEARSVLGAWKKSGLGLEAFARSRGLVPQRLYWWRKKLGFGVVAYKRVPLALLPVQVTPAKLGRKWPLMMRKGWPRLTANWHPGVGLWWCAWPAS
jgi:hypothetical protein